VFLRAAVVSRKERGKGEGEEEKLTNLFMIPKHNVGLEVVQREGVSVEVLHHEGISSTEGGGALEGS